MLPKFAKAVNILGTKYSIAIKNFKDEPRFEKRSIDGYHDGILKQIAIVDMHSYPGYEDESEEMICETMKQTLRHEIVHAFLCESGLDECSGQYECAWAKNEEMVDWIALQGTKIYEAWKKAGAI